MVPKVNKGKGLASSSHGSKRERRPSEEEHENVSMAPPPLRRYDCCWDTKKEVSGKHVTRERVCSVYVLNTGMPINVGVLIKNVLKRATVKKGQNFEFRGLLTRFLRGHDIEEEEADYRAAYDPRGVHMTKIKEPEGINGPVLTVNERNARIDNMLSYLFGMQMLQFRMNGSWAWIQGAFVDDMAMEDKMARVDSDIESSDDDEEDSEMGEAALARGGPTWK
ncbi:hypothetical protein HAX54_007629, partial [Datura stramonium]|nr:hypothetical protein [Datura stramonium]